MISSWLDGSTAGILGEKFLKCFSRILKISLKMLIMDKKFHKDNSSPLLFFSF